MLERFDSDVLMVEDEYGELRLTPEMRVKVDELFVEIGGGPDIDAKSFRGALVHLGIVVSDNEAASMFEAADSMAAALWIETSSPTRSPGSWRPWSSCDASRCSLPFSCRKCPPFVPTIATNRYITRGAG